MRDDETLRILRPRPDEWKTEEIPRYDEEDEVEDNWGKATGRVPDGDPYEGLPTTCKSTADEIKQRNLALLTAAVMWFFLACVLAVVGSFVIKLIGHILGG